MIRRAALVIAACAALLPGLAQAGALQDMIDAAPDGAEIVLPAGVHEGPIVITHPVVIDGQGAAVIDGGGTGTVVTIETNGVTLKNLTIRNSGRLHNKVDAGLRIHGSFNVIRDVRIENSLFGMDLTQASNNVLRRNYISSKDMPLEMRGELGADLVFERQYFRTEPYRAFARFRDLVFRGQQDP